MDSESEQARTNDRRRFRNWKRHQRRLEKRAEEKIDGTVVRGDDTEKNQHHGAMGIAQESKSTEDDIHRARKIENVRRKLIRQVSSRLKHLDHLEMLRTQAESNTNSAERDPSQSAVFRDTVGRLRNKLSSLKCELETLIVIERRLKSFDQAKALFGGKRIFSFESADELLAIREEWDAYADEQGQTIPVQWMVPGIPDPEWSIYESSPSSLEPGV